MNKKPSVSKGKRANCGRKPVADKKMQVYVFVRQSKIEKLGGKDALKIKLNKYIESII